MAYFAPSTRTGTLLVSVRLLNLEVHIVSSRCFEQAQMKLYAFYCDGNTERGFEAVKHELVVVFKLFDKFVDGAEPSLPCRLR